MEKKRLALLGCGKLNHIVADAYLNGFLPEYEVVGVLGRSEEKAAALAEKLEYHINSVPGMEGDDYIIETEVEEVGVKAVLNIYSKTAEIAGWSIVEVLQNAVSPIVF